MSDNEFEVTLPEDPKGSYCISPDRSDLWTELTDLGEDLVPFCEITGVSKSLSPIPSLPSPLEGGEMAHGWARCPDQRLSL